MNADELGTFQGTEQVLKVRFTRRVKTVLISSLNSLRISTNILSTPTTLSDSNFLMMCLILSGIVLSNVNTVFVKFSHGD